MARGETGNRRKPEGRRQPPHAGKPARRAAKPKRDYDRLEAELHTARQRIEVLEAERTEVRNRIDRIVDSLQTLLAGGQ